jgi:hypothetical protein
MATGDVTWFNQGLADVLNKIHDFDTDDWRIGIVTTATTPSKTTAAPHWGGTGTTNFATSQVSTGGTSYTGPVALSSETIAISGNNIEWRAGKVGPLAQDASGFTNGAWGIIYNNTDTNKRAVAFVELSAAGSLSLVAGPVEIRWNNVDGTGQIARLAN